MSALYKKFDLDLHLKFELTEDEIRELVNIKNNKSKDKNYLKEVTPDLLKLEELCLVYRCINESSRQDYWFITFIGGKVLEKYSFKGIE